MPPLQFFLFLLVLLGFNLHKNALKLANGDADDEPQPYCILKADQEGVSTFCLGERENLICSRGKFFNFDINPQTLAVPIGCQICPRGTHYMDSRNYCPKCKECKVCGDGEVEIPESCTPYRNRICEKITATNIVPSNVTGGDRQDVTASNPTTRLTVISTPSPTCPPCVSRAPSLDTLPTTVLSRKEGELTKPEQKQCIDQNVLASFCGVFGVIAVIAVVIAVMYYKKYLKWKKTKRPNNSDDHREVARDSSVTRL